MTEPGTAARLRGLAACAAAFALYALGNWLLTNKFFPLATPTAPLSRDIGTLVQGAGLLALTFAATRRPRALRAWMFSALPAGLLAGGVALVLLGAGRSAALVTLGVALVELVSSFVVVALGCTLLAREGVRSTGVGVLVGLTAALVLRIPFDALHGTAAVVGVFCAVQLALVALTAPPARTVLVEVAQGASPEELCLTNPFSFLPLNHRLFMCLALFQLSYGFAIGFGEIGDTPVTTFAGIVPLALVCAATLACRHLPKIDVLFAVAFLLVVAGFLFVPLSHDAALPAASNLLEAGSSCFSLVYWLTVAALARRNRAGALSLFAWGGCILSVGVVAGAFLGRLGDTLLANSPVATSLACNLVVLALVACALLPLKRFSFDATVEGLADSPQVATSERADIPDLLRSVQALARQSGLTPREAEVFELLAQGRNGVNIQQRLGVSYNTVKTHVAHIYAKLGVHTHQELIDLVMGHGGPGRPGKGLQVGKREA